MIYVQTTSKSFSVIVDLRDDVIKDEYRAVLNRCMKTKMFMFNDTKYLIKNVNNKLDVMKILCYDIPWSTLLVVCAEIGYMEGVQYCLAITTNKKDLALIRAVNGNHLDVVVYLIEHANVDHSIVDNVLYMSSENGNLALTEYLFKHVTSTYYCMTSALVGGHQEIIDFYIGKGFTITFGEQITQLIMMGCRESVIRFLDDGDRIQAITIAMIHNQPDIARTIIETRGPFPAEELHKLFTECIKQNDLEMVEFLAKSGYAPTDSQSAFCVEVERQSTPDQE